ncbi:MAG: UDP-N-acetylmuramoyl-tripeptide--D-alanyl-D-alanine ligase [Pseudomonadota bacterium]
MTALWTSGEAEAATGGASTAPWSASGVSIDSRTIAPGDLFVALRDRRDGHAFLASAFAAGAAAALVDTLPSDLPAGAPCLVVEDSLRALEALGRAARARSRAMVFAVTGSVGKTGTKEMLRTALGALGAVHASDKSYNNHWGVPLSLARMPREVPFAVFEIGMNAPGEIAPLSRLVRPDVAIVTTVAPVHLAAFDSVDGIAAEKASVFQGLPSEGLAVINRDIPWSGVLEGEAVRAGARLTGFGREASDMRLVSAEIRDQATVVAAEDHGRPFVFRLSAPGRHLAMNATAVLAAVAGQGLDLARAALALGSWSPPEGRGTRQRILLGPSGLDGAIALLDESYNANPAAMGAAFEVFAATSVEDGIGRVRRGRRLAFLGDMLELGPGAADMHAALARHPAMASIDRVHTAGPLMRALHDALPPERQGEWHPDTEALAARVRALVDAGDAVMVKGSLGSKLSRVVDALRALGEAVPVTIEGGQS